MSLSNQLTGQSTVPLIPASQLAPAENKPPETSQIQSLADFRARVKERECPQIENLVVFPHEALGMTLYLGRMSSQGYIAVENVARYIPHGTQWAGQKMSSNAEDDRNRDIAYLMHAVFFQNEKGFERFTRDDAILLMDLDGAGAANRALMHAIRELNPPREELTQQMAGALACTTMATVVVRTLLDIGLGRAIVHFLAPSATEKEKEWAIAQIQQVEEVFLELDAIMGTRDTMNRMGFHPKPITSEQYESTSNPGSDSLPA
ncbi:hypothetical protein IAD21_00569 [Abditibacteriota bacterium]|nr:hypothetical protein IAD21_00569 [Abditibacteriota bacterium]